MPYQDMSERELTIKLYAKVENLCDDVAEIKERLNEQTCPGEAGICKVHHDDLQRLKYRNELMAWIFGAVATVLSVAVAVIALVGFPWW